MLEFYMQNLTALVALLLALACAASVRGWLILCGFLLALSTVKPQISAVFVLFFLIWVAGDWKVRRRLAFSFSLTLFSLAFGAELLLPGWLWAFLAALRRYWRYTANPSGVRMFFPAPVAWILSGALVGALFWAVWRRRKRIAGSTDFGWLLALVSAVTVVIAPIAFYNQLVLIPALLALLAQRENANTRGFAVRGLAKAPFACLGWHWISAAALGLTSLVVPAERLHSAAYAPSTPCWPCLRSHCWRLRRPQQLCLFNPLKTVSGHDFAVSVGNRDWYHWAGHDRWTMIAWP